MSSFSVPAFVISFRESLEVAVIISSLILVNSFVFRENRIVGKKLNAVIWTGTVAGIVLTIIVGGVLIAVSNKLGPTFWGRKGDLWEGILALVGATFMTVMAFGIFRMRSRDSISSKFALSLGKVSQMDGKLMKYYPLFLIPFVTVARENLEALLFIAGIVNTLGISLRAIIISSLLGIAVGAVVGVLLHFFGKFIDMTKILFGISVTLIIMSSALVTKAAWSFEHYQWAKYLAGDSDEGGTSIQYNIKKVVWALACCDPRIPENGWGVLQTFFGWNNVAYNSTIWTYFAYWVVVSMAAILYRRRSQKLTISNIKEQGTHSSINECQSDMLMSEKTVNPE